MNYNEITSEYIKKMFHETYWQDHEKIDDLFKLHGYILNPPETFSSGMLFTRLKSKYRAAYLDLLREFSPEALEKELAEELELSKNRIRHIAEFELLEEQAKKSWLSAGGKL